MVLLKKHVVDNEELMGWLKTKLQESLEEPKELLNIDALTSLLPGCAIS